jgi:hypothetical protein
MSILTDTDLCRLQAHIDAKGSPDGFVPTPTKRRKHTESAMQRALIRWWSVACRGFKLPEEVLFAIPNGGLRGAKEGHFMRLEGVRKGVPDLMLAVGRFSRIKPDWHVEERIHGLFIELKTHTGRLSVEQECYHGILRAAGYRVEVVRSFDEAIKAITRYLT